MFIRKDDIDYLLNIIGYEFAVPTIDIIGESNKRPIPDCKLIAFDMLVNVGKQTVTFTGRHLNRDHSTVSSRLAKDLNNLIETNSEFRKKRLNILKKWEEYLLKTEIKKVNLIEMLNQLNFITKQVELLIQLEYEK